MKQGKKEGDKVIIEERQRERFKKGKKGRETGREVKEGKERGRDRERG